MGLACNIYVEEGALLAPAVQQQPLPLALDIREVGGNNRAPFMGGK